VAGGPDGADDIAGPAEAGSPFNVMIGGIGGLLLGAARARAGGRWMGECSRSVVCMWESVSQELIACDPSSRRREP